MRKLANPLPKMKLQNGTKVTKQLYLHSGNQSKEYKNKGLLIQKSYEKVYTWEPVELQIRVVGVCVIPDYSCIPPLLPNDGCGGSA